jgi:predicted histidine transporter YuiF (NhaC family)
MREEGWEGDILNGKAGQALKRNSISAMLTVLFLIIAAFIGWHEFTDILIEGVTLLGVVGCGVVIVSVAISELYQLSLIESVKERFESKLLE